MNIEQLNYFTRCIGCVHDLDGLHPQLIFNT